MRRRQVYSFGARGVERACPGTVTPLPQGKDRPRGRYADVVNERHHVAFGANTHVEVAASPETTEFA